MGLATEHDVVVLGGGPSGAAAAIRLCELGLNVAIVERASFPRSHVGICLSDETVRLIDHLGLLRQLEATKPCRRGLTAVKWGEARPRLVQQSGCHVDRAAFDQQMLSRAQSAGAVVHQPAQVLEVISLGERGWRILVRASGERQELLGKLIIDAAGRRGASRGKRLKDGPVLLCIHAPWQLTKAPEFDGLIEAGDEAWQWFARTSFDRGIVSVFCDPRRLSECSLQGNYGALLRQFTVLRLADVGQQQAAALACDAGSHHAETPLDDCYIRIGDACLSVDPLSSQGVHLALQSGLQAAVIVNTVLRRPASKAAAHAFYRARVAERAAHYSSRTRQEYARVAASGGGAFWRERADGVVAATGSDHLRPTEFRNSSVVGKPPHGPVLLSTDAVLGNEPVIVDDFVEVRPVVRHPGLGRTVAYVDGFDLAQLISMLPAAINYDRIPECWRSLVPLATGRKIASWLWNKGVIVEENGAAQN